VVDAPNGAAALDVLANQPVEAVVSDVKMPRMDGFQLCRALRRDPRWARLPFVFYSGIFTGHRAHELGMDLGATAYLDANHVPPDRIAREIDAVVKRVASAEYREALVQVRDDLEFARRYHQVVLSSLVGEGDAGVRDTISSNVNALDEILARLDEERHALAKHTDITVPVTELNRLKELSDYLDEKINQPLGVILERTHRAATDSPREASSEAATNVRAAVRRINELVRKMTRRDASAERT
jgi:CheY-like chemotaxis protein